MLTNPAMCSKGSEIRTNSNSLHQGKFGNILPSDHLQNKDSVNPAKKLSSNTVFRRFFDESKIEILAFLILFSMSLTQITATSIILNKVCLVHYNYTQEICNSLYNHSEIKTMVEKMATNYQIGYSLIQTVPSALLSCFIGPWSDMYGRKLPTLIAIFGISVGTLGSALCAYFMYSRVEFFYIPALLSSCLGGVITILAVIYSYASDLTTQGHRTIKYAFLEMAIGLGQPLGTAAGGWALEFLGYPSVFLISASGFIISFIWVKFLLPETRGQDNDGNLKFRKLFTCKALKENFEATTKERPNMVREQILLLITSMCVAVTAIYGTGSITYLFVHHQYNWEETKYSTITAIYSIVAVMMIAVIVPTSKYYNFDDPILGLVGTVSLILKYICFGLAWNPILFHFGSILGCMAGCMLIAARSRISKVVSSDDLGKVFSLMASAETLFPVLMIVFISQIFNACLNIYAAMPYIVLASSMVLPLSVFIWITRLAVKDSTYKCCENERMDD